MTDEQWADYVFMRRNPKGRHHERWHHVHGCRRWFNLVRDTVSDRVLAAYRMGEAPPGTDGGTPPSPDGGTPPSPDGGTPPSPDGGTPPSPDGGPPPSPAGGTP